MRDGEQGGSNTFLIVILAATVLGAILLFALREGPGRPEMIDGKGEPGATGGGPDRPEVPEEGFVLVDVAKEAGVTLPNLCGTAGKPNIIEANGSGAALLDFDLDGDLDLYIVNGAYIENLHGRAEPVRNALYRNDGNWSFIDVAAEAGVADTGWGYGCAVGDIDNDGDPDLYVTNYGPNLLYENGGDGTFREIAEASGVGDEGWGESAAFGDIDNDGDLDLYVSNNLVFDIDNLPRGGEPCVWRGLKVFCGPLGLLAQEDRLYRNEGGLRFADVSEESGVHDPAPQYGLGVMFADYDEDGLVDIYVANDSVPNFLFHNLGEGKFEEVARAAGLATKGDGSSQAGMGVAYGDFDQDGRSDFYVTNFSNDYNTLYWNIGEGLFMDVTESQGLGKKTWRKLGWGTALIDFDNDTDLDLYVANGHVSPVVDGSPLRTSYRQADQIFVNRGEGSYDEESGRIVISGGPRSSRGAAFGDIDNDGDVDVLVIEIDAPPTLLENRGGNAGAWLQIRLVGAASNREGAGTRVSVSVGEKVQRRQMTRSGSYCSSNDPRLIFGLGEATAVDKVEVRWPSGKVQVFENVIAGQEVTIHETDGLVAAPKGRAGVAEPRAPTER